MERGEHNIFEGRHPSREGNEKKSKGSKSKGGKGKGTKGSTKSMGMMKRSTSRGTSGKGYTPTPATTAPSVLLDDVPGRRANFCRVNSMGNFGIERGDETLVHYFYQVEAEPGTTRSQFEKILPSAEIATVNIIIPDLFGALCGWSTRKLQPELLAAGGGTSIYLGISTQPADRVLDNAGCGAMSLHPCYVVNGAITTYSEGKSLEAVQTEVSLLLQDVFNFGNLAALVPGVDGVTFLELPPELSPTRPKPTQSHDVAIIPTPASLSPLPTQAATQAITLMPTITTDGPADVPAIVSTDFPAVVPIDVPAVVPTDVPTVVSAVVPAVVPTFVPTVNPALPLDIVPEEPVEEDGSSKEESNGGILEWWRWFLVALIILFMLVAIFVIYRYPDKSKRQNRTVELDE